MNEQFKGNLTITQQAANLNKNKVFSDILNL
jgi:hypothetical protein